MTSEDRKIKIEETFAMIHDLVLDADCDCVESVEKTKYQKAVDEMVEAIFKHLTEEQLDEALSVVTGIWEDVMT